MDLKEDDTVFAMIKATKYPSKRNSPCLSFFAAELLAASLLAL
jgi:hypothetical protein